MAEQLEGCDRRMSRAAREILVNKTVPILTYYHNSTDNYDRTSFASLAKTKRLSSYGELISNLIDPRSKNCMLHPKMDMYWEEEIKHVTLNSKSRRHAQGSRKEQIHRCPICQKKFFSRYYLDLHMDSHLGPKEEKKICPAHEVCNVLTQAACARKALEQEPYYAPGLHGPGSAYSNHIRLDFQKKMESTPCIEQDMKRNDEECSIMVSECFGHNKPLARDLKNALCKHTCERKLHNLAGLSNIDLHEIRAHYVHNHNIFPGWIFVFAFFLASLFYLKSIQNFLRTFFGRDKKLHVPLDSNKRKKLD